MTKPLALFFNQNLLLGSQLVNRLQDLGYRVQVIMDLRKLVEQARQEKPLVVVVDLAGGKADVFMAMRSLRESPDTNHIPVLAIANEADTTAVDAARDAGATLVAAEKALLVQLPHLLDRVLEVE